MVIAFLILVVGLYFFSKVNIWQYIVGDKQFDSATLTGFGATSDKSYQQRQQEKARKARRRSKAIQTVFVNRKAFLATLQPTQTKLLWIGSYMLCKNLCTILYGLHRGEFLFLSIFTLLITVFLLIYAIFLNTKRYPAWIIGSYWLGSLLLCFPLHIIYGLWHAANPLILLICSVTNCGIMLWALPFYPGVVVVAFFPIFYCICVLRIASFWPLPGLSLFILVGCGMVTFVVMIYSKFAITKEQNQKFYLITQQKREEAYKLKSLAYNWIPTPNVLATEGIILEQAIQNVVQSISFLDEDTVLYKEDFQSIINKFSEWAIYLKQQARSKVHLLLHPTVIDLDDLIDQVEIELEQELGYLPRLFIERCERSGKLPATLVADRDQLVTLLVAAITDVIKESQVVRPFITLALHTTHLQYKRIEETDGFHSPFMVFPAIALLCNYGHMSDIPLVADVYGDLIEDAIAGDPNFSMQEKLDLVKDKIETAIRAHYGYLSIPHPHARLLVVPQDVTQIRAAMLSKLPITVLKAEESSITVQEQSASLVRLMEFHEWVSTKTAAEPAVIAEILLLLRRCYGFKRHPCGELFYLRAVGIAESVATWLFHTPKPIYASLLYELVRYTHLPLSYIRANYNLGIFAFVANLVEADSHAKLEASLLQIGNRFQVAVDRAHFSVLYIKLAERLYDLRHVAGYADVEVVRSMAQETLTIDVPLASCYLEPEVAQALERAAHMALDFCQVQA